MDHIRHSLQIREGVDYPAIPVVDVAAYLTDGEVSDTEETVEVATDGEDTQLLRTSLRKSFAGAAPAAVAPPATADDGVSRDYLHCAEVLRRLYADPDVVRELHEAKVRERTATTWYRDRDGVRRLDVARASAHFLDDLLLHHHTKHRDAAGDATWERLRDRVARECAVQQRQTAGDAATSGETLVGQLLHRCRQLEAESAGWRERHREAVDHVAALLAAANWYDATTTRPWAANGLSEPALAARLYSLASRMTDGM